MESEKQQLKKEIDELEALLAPKKERMRQFYVQELQDTEAKIKRCERNLDRFTPEELRYAAESRCYCGAGLAYPTGIGIHGAWYCSDILLGQAIPHNQTGSKEHTAPLPFAFYEIKSEIQPGGLTTRPTK